MLFTRKKAIVFVVTIGALMSISSIFIYNLVINEKHYEIRNLEDSIVQKEDLIKEVWQNTLALENKKDLLLLMILQNEQKNDEYLDKYIKETMEGSGLSIEDMPNAPTEKFAMISSKINEKREKAHEQIDNAYFEKVYLQEEIHQQKNESDKYSMMALFLQAIGLMFILSKDVIRDL